jgi:hypothetical protein
MATPIGTLGTIPTLTVGGRVYTDLTTLKIVVGMTKSGGVNGTFRVPKATSGYQVTTGKTLTVSSARMLMFVGSGPYNSTILQSDNDVGSATSTAFTNPSYYNGDSSNTTLFSAGTGITGITGLTEVGGIDFAVASQKYLSVLGTTGGQAMHWAYGYEA